MSSLVSTENRLLIIVIAISAGALLLLARFRFPGEQRPVNPAPAPLERLAAQATFDDLASIVAQAQTRVAPALLVLRVIGRAPRASVLAPSGEASEHNGSASRRLVLAARVRQDIAVAQLAPGDHVESIIGVTGVPEMVAFDAVRMLGLIRVPPETTRASFIWEPQDPISSPRYVAVAEATPGGPTLRPLFLGRTDPFTTARWERPLLALGAAGVTQPGSLVFSLSGRLEGLTLLEERLPVMVPVRALLAAVQDLEKGPIGPAGDLGIELSNLTPALIAATGADHGAIVRNVRPNGPAADHLRVGDVVLALDESRVLSAEMLAVRVARTPPGTALTLETIRQRVPRSVRVNVGVLPEQPILPSGSGMLGLTLRAAPEIGSEVLRVEPRSAASAADLAPGDVITVIGDVQAPTPAAVQQAFRAASPGSYLLVGLQRGEQHLVIGLHKP